MKQDEFKWKTYFILKAIPHGDIPDFLSDQVEKNEMYVSANIKLNSPVEMAYIKSRELAEQFRDACRGRLVKRYGHPFDLNIVECSSRENKTIQSRIEIDSGKIKKRLHAANFSSHRPV